MEKIPITPMPMYDAESLIKLLACMEIEINQVVLPIEGMSEKRLALATIIDDYCKIISHYAVETVRAQNEHAKG